MIQLFWGPTELLAQSKPREARMRSAASHRPHEFFASSADKPQSRFTTMLKSSPSSIGTPFSSSSNLSNVIGFVGGCSFKLAQMVSAWMAGKSLLKI